MTIVHVMCRKKQQVDGDNSGEYILPMEVIQILEDIINERNDSLYVVLPFSRFQNKRCLYKIMWMKFNSLLGISYKNTSTISPDYNVFDMDKTIRCM